MKRLVLFFVSVTLLTITSCIIEKRQYMPGYHVELIGRKAKGEEQRAKGEERRVEGEVRRERPNKAEEIKVEVQEVGQVIVDSGHNILPELTGTELKTTSLNLQTTRDRELLKPKTMLKMGYSTLTSKDVKKDDQLVLGLIMFIGGLAAMIGLAFAYSGYGTLPGIALVLLIGCLVICIIGYVLIEDAVPGLGCLLLMLLQLFASILR